MPANTPVQHLGRVPVRQPVDSCRNSACSFPNLLDEVEDGLLAHEMCPAAPVQHFSWDLHYIPPLWMNVVNGGEQQPGQLRKENGRTDRTCPAVRKVYRFPAAVELSDRSNLPRIQAGETFLFRTARKLLDGLFWIVISFWWAGLRACPSTLNLQILFIIKGW